MNIKALVVSLILGSSSVASLGSWSVAVASPVRRHSASKRPLNDPPPPRPKKPNRGPVKGQIVCYRGMVGCIALGHHVGPDDIPGSGGFRLPPVRPTPLT